MQIIIIGAGRIGCAVAENLVSEANDITVIDENAERIEELQNRLDLRGVVGDATSPKLLKQAGAEDADMILAVTNSDETNLVVSLLGARLFNTPIRIARVRKNELRDYPRLMAEEGFGITSTIWPEEALTENLYRLIEFPEALQVIDFADGKVSLIAVRAAAGSPLVGRPIRDLSAHLPDVPARIVTVFRRNRNIDITSETLIEGGDEVIILSASREMRRVINELRKNEKPSRNIILGGNYEISKHLAENLKGHAYNIKIVENDSKAVHSTPRSVNTNSIVLNGDMMDPNTLEEAGIDTCDLFVALSHDDENNIMSSLLAKKLGAARVISLINSKVYGDLMQGTQIDITVSLTQATLGELLKHVRRGDVVAAHSLRRGVAEALEVIAHGSEKNSKVVGRQIQKINLPDGVSIAAVVREGAPEEEPKIIMAAPSLTIESEDHVIVFVSNKRLIPKVESLFMVDVGFF